jgi:hypothetical protein
VFIERESYRKIICSTGDVFVEGEIYRNCIRSTEEVLSLGNVHRERGLYTLCMFDWENVFTS